MANYREQLQTFHLMEAEKVLVFVEMVLQYQQPEAEILQDSLKRSLCHILHIFFLYSSVLIIFVGTLN